jgi:uncharacterized protein (DUF2062 family)
MVFKRRERRSVLRIVGEALWPRGGWSRAAQYIKHRLHRIPDSPHRIARGIASGVFISFTPLYGLHFLASALVAMMIRGNVVAALLATFFGNPLTFPIIAALSMQLGNRILGKENGAEADGTLGQKFGNAFGELWHNVRAVFTPEVAHWDGLRAFYSDVFLPYFAGGFVPGLLAGWLAYRLSLPVITAYQHRRRGRLQAKFAELRGPSPRLAKDGEARGKAPSGSAT